jgi:hypothetical protein
MTPANEIAKRDEKSCLLAPLLGVHEIAPVIQLTLPQNSRIKPRKTWPKPASAARLAYFRI